MHRYLSKSVPKVFKGRYTRGSLLPQHALATHSRSKAPSSAPTISSEKICCATKLLLPSSAPSYQTGLIWGSKLQGQICCTSLFQEQAPSCVPALVLWSILQGGNSAPENEFYPWNHWYTRRSFAPGACVWSKTQEQNTSCVLAGVLTRSVFGSVFQEQAPSCVPALIDVMVEKGNSEVWESLKWYIKPNFVATMVTPSLSSSSFRLN